MSDLKTLRDLTLSCLKEGIDWYSHDDLVKGKVSSFDHDFVTAFAPVVVLGLLDQLEAAQKAVARYSVYDEVIAEIDRRADKEWCLSDGCDFTVTITHEQYQAIDAATGNGRKETP